MAKRIRAIIKNALLDATESLKMGIPNYSINKESIAAIADYTNHLSLNFFSGAKLSSKLLQGTGKGMRHIAIKNTYDIDERRVTWLLKQARNLAWTEKDLPNSKIRTN
jgi:hypothetical protein